MFQPKRTKYRKFQKGQISGKISNTMNLSFGKYGLKSIEAGRLSSQVIEAVRRTMTRKLRRAGQIWIRVFPDIAVSEKPAEVRMGKGKGNPSFWISRIKKGQILFELDGISIELAKQAVFLGAQKIPLSTKFIQID
jgi:large subunit ribosomal protein L16